MGATSRPGPRIASQRPAHAHRAQVRERACWAGPGRTFRCVGGSAGGVGQRSCACAESLAGSWHELRARERLSESCILPSFEVGARVFSESLLQREGTPAKAAFMRREEPLVCEKESEQSCEVLGCEVTAPRPTAPVRLASRCFPHPLGEFWPGPTFRSCPLT